jgi:hypothetical protein
MDQRNRGRGDGDGSGVEKYPRARPNQLVSVWDTSLWSILDEWLYNGAAASTSTSEHGTRPSSHEATARPSSGCEEDVFANIPACRRLGNVRCTCPYELLLAVALHSMICFSNNPATNCSHLIKRAGKLN